MENFDFRTLTAPLATIFFVLGLSLLIWPGAFKRLNRVTKKWISTRKILRPLEIPREIDEHLFKIRKVTGIVLLALALFFLYVYKKF